jgi:hypothetical protein
MAGAGCAMAVLGAVLLSVDTGAGNDGFSRWPGLLLSAAVVAVGVILQQQSPKGPLATAGTVAIILGMPPLLVFATYREHLPPYQTNAVVVLSTLAFAAAYLVGSGRGRPAFLGAAAIGVWATVLQLTEHVLDLPYVIIQLIPGMFFFDSGSSFDSTGSLDSGSFSTSSQSGFPNLPDATTVGILSLAIGLAYLAGSRWLDRRGCHGVATPLLVAAFPALYIGAAALSGDLRASGTALLYIVLGLALALHGASMARRATTWIGGAWIAFGALELVFDSADSASAAGGGLIALGIMVVVGAQLLATSRHEPDEMALAAPGQRTGRSTKSVVPAPEPPDASEASPFEL